MCCIIHRPKDATKIPEYNLKRIVKINPDGWGLSYYKDNIVHVVKSMDMDEAIDKVRELEDENLEFLFHARYTTHGKTNIQNCHPYEVENGVLFHNGKIKVFCRNKNMSDTYYFSLKYNKYIRKGRTIDWIIDKYKVGLGESRLAIMTHEGEIIKHGEWHEINGCSYSKKNWQWETYSYNKGGSKQTSSYSGAEFGWGGEYDGWLGSTKSKFEETMEQAANGKIFYTYEVKNLTEEQLCELAVKYPGLCADYLHRETYNIL